MWSCEPDQAKKRSSICEAKILKSDYLGWTAWSWSLPASASSPPPRPRPSPLLFHPPPLFFSLLLCRWSFTVAAASALSLSLSTQEQWAFSSVWEMEMLFIKGSREVETIGFWSFRDMAVPWNVPGKEQLHHHLMIEMRRHWGSASTAE